MNAPETGIVDVRTDARGFVGRAYGTRHKSWLVGLFCGKFVGHFSGQSRRGQIEFVAQLFHAIVGHRHTLCVKGVGFSDVGACLEIGSVNVLNDDRLGKAEQLIIALQIAVPISKTHTSIIGFAQFMLLNLRAHGTIQNQNTLFCRSRYWMVCRVHLLH